MICEDTLVYPLYLHTRLRSRRSYSRMRESLLVMRILSSPGMAWIPVTFLPRPFLLLELWTWIVV